jgi:hypothetical protein
VGRPEGAGAAAGRAATGAGAASFGAPGARTRRFTVSTTTALDRPWEKLCRTVFCSAGRFGSDNVFGETCSVLSPGVFVSLIQI